MNNLSFLKGRKAWYLAAGAAVILLAFFILASVNSARASSAGAEASGKVVSLEVAETVESSGSLEAQSSASLEWKTGGVVDEVFVQAGDGVQAGDVLMKLKTTSVASNIISAQADLVTAQENLDDLLRSSDTDLAQAVIALKDAQEDYDKAEDYLQYLKTSEKIPQTEVRTYLEQKRNGWSYTYKTNTFKGPAPEDWIIEAENDLALKKGELQDAQYEVDRLKDGPNAQDVIAAQAKVDAAQATVDSMSIIAPFDSKVLYVSSQPGDVIDAGAAAVNIANLDSLYVETRVDESDILKIKIGNPVTATLDAAPGIVLTGKVTAVNPVGENLSGLVKYTVRVTLDKQEQDVFLPLGTTVNVTIQVKEASATLAVPITAIQNDSQGEFVLVVQKDGSTKRVAVVSGSIIGDLVGVTGEVQEGDTLSTKSSGRVRMGPFGGGE